MASNLQLEEDDHKNYSKLTMFSLLLPDSSHKNLYLHLCTGKPRFNKSEGTKIFCYL
jgi:hypothetical protein